MKIITPADKNFFLAWYDLFKKLIKKKKYLNIKTNILAAKRNFGIM